MKWLGQHIVELIARFRSSIYLENLESSSETAALVVDSNGKITKNASLVSSGTTDLTSDVTGVLPVTNGGTGASSLAITSLLTGNGTSPVQAESGLTYNGELLVVGDNDAGLAEVTRKNSSTATAGQFRLRGSTATGTDKVGGELSLAGGPGTGTAAGGAIKFYNWTPYGGSGSSSQTAAVEIAGFDSAGNLQIDGGLTTGSTSAINSSGVIQVASQPNITTLEGVFTGAANQLLTDDGDGTVSSESKLTYDGSARILEFGGEDIYTDTIRKKTSSGIAGDFRIYGSAAAGTNKAGGDIEIYSGKGTGSASGGAIKFYVSTPGSSGDTSHFVQAVDMTITNGQVAVAGNITVTGTVDGVDIAARDHAAVTLANTNYLSLSGQEITGGTVPVASGGTGSTSASDARTALGVDASGTDNSTNVTLAGSLDYITLSGQEITRNAIDLAADVTGTLPVGNGGTGATTLTSNAVLTGNGTSAITPEQTLSYDSETLTIGADDNGIASIHRRTHGDDSGGRLEIKSGNATGTNKVGGALMLSAGAGTGTGTGGSIVFYSHSAGSSGSAQGTATDIATLTSAGDLQIDGDLTVDGNNITNNASATNFTIDSSRVLQLQHAGSYNIEMGNSTNTQVLTVAGDSEVVTVNGTLELGHASDTTIARSAAGKVSIEGDDIQTQGEKIGQYFQIKIKDLNSYMFYMYNDDYWYSAGSGTLAILGNSSAPGNISSANSEYQSRTSCYTAVAACTVKKLQLTFYWSSSAVNSADIDFGFSKFTPITDGTAAIITMNAITATDCDGSYTENKPYQKTFTFSGGNASLSAGDALGFHMRTTGGSSAQRVFIYGTAILSVELD